MCPHAQTGKTAILIAHLQMDEYSVSAERRGGYPYALAFYSQGMPEHRVTLTPTPGGETTIVLAQAEC